MCAEATARDHHHNQNKIGGQEMTLAELKSQIVNIENQLSSIDIPIKFGSLDVAIILGLAVDQSGKLYVTFVSNDTNQHTTIPKPETMIDKIRNLGVMEKVTFKYPGKRPFSVQAYTCKLGKQLGRRYKTRTNVLDHTVTVFRVE